MFLENDSVISFPRISLLSDCVLFSRKSRVCYLFVYYSTFCWFLSTPSHVFNGALGYVQQFSGRAHPRPTALPLDLDWDLSDIRLRQVVPRRSPLSYIVDDGAFWVQLGHHHVVVRADSFWRRSADHQSKRGRFAILFAVIIFRCNDKGDWRCYEQPILVSGEIDESSAVFVRQLVSAESSNHQSEFRSVVTSSYASAFTRIFPRQTPVGGAFPSPSIFYR